MELGLLVVFSQENGVCPAANAQAEEESPEGESRKATVVFCGRCSWCVLRIAADTTQLWSAKNSPQNVAAKRNSESSVELTPGAPFPNRVVEMRKRW